MNLCKQQEELHTNHNEHIPIILYSNFGGRLYCLLLSEHIIKMEISEIGFPLGA